MQLGDINKALIEDAMDLAVKKALSQKGFTSPNPWVGAVLIPKGSKDLSSCFIGVTQPPGQDHAEVVAIKKAGSLSNGATLVVTLEPCCHWGKTPPCVDRIIDAKISTVVIGISDPDSRVNTKGIKALVDAGINVVTGVKEEKVRESLKEYLYFKEKSRPYVTLKLAISLDGKIATGSYISKWITSEASRRDAHRLRRESDAILIGSTTYLKDKPALTVRTPSNKVIKEPLKVVLSSRSYPDERFLFYSGSLEELLADLAKKGVINLLVEGGSNVAGSFLSKGLVNRCVFYVAPVIIGKNGINAVDLVGPDRLEEALWFNLVEVKKIGNDVKIVTEPKF